MPVRQHRLASVTDAYAYMHMLDPAGHAEQSSCTAAGADNDQAAIEAAAGHAGLVACSVCLVTVRLLCLQCTYM